MRGSDQPGADALSSYVSAEARVPASPPPRHSAVPEALARSEGYLTSQRIRMRIEAVVGWGREIGGMRRTSLRGLDRVGWSFTLRVAAYNLVRLPQLLSTPA